MTLEQIAALPVGEHKVKHNRLIYTLVVFSLTSRGLRYYPQGELGCLTTDGQLGTSIGAFTFWGDINWAIEEFELVTPQTPDTQAPAQPEKTDSITTQLNYQP